MSPNGYANKMEKNPLIYADIKTPAVYERVDYRKKYGSIYETEIGHHDKMGVSVEDNGCNVAIQADTTDAVDVCLFDSNNPNEAIERHRLNRVDQNSNIFTGFIDGMQVGDIYGLRVSGENKDYDKLIVDPYAKALTGDFDALSYPYEKNKNSSLCIPKCIVVDESYNWTGDKKPNIQDNERIIYEGHVKGLTVLNKEIPEKYRGKYAGIGSKPFTDYLNNLGITSLELMPVQHFVSESHLQEKGLKNYWGYNTLGFFAPHADYAIENQNGNQVTEFKDMVKNLHKANIEVIMDVVYNHTPEGSENGPTLMFKGLNENEMYHLSNDKKHCNYSGCGNTINASSDAGFNFIIDSLHYWVTEMHIDGFRFDLAPILAREQPNGSINMQGRFMKALETDPILSKVNIIFEPWDCASDESGHSGRREWNGKYRDDMRKYWLKGGGLGNYATRLSGSFATDKAINFITAHDGFTLNDTVSYNDKHNQANGENSNDGTDNNESYNFGVEGKTDDENIRNRRQRVMQSMVLSMLVSTGTPMLSHGDEIMRTQYGNNNAYCQDNEITWMPWNLSDDQKKFLKFTSEVIHFRKAHPVFNRQNNFTGQPVLGQNTEADVAWFKNNGYQFEHNDEAWKRKGIIGMYMSGIAVKNTVKSELNNDHCFLYYANGTHDDQEVYLPKQRPYAGNYEVVIDSATGEVLNSDHGRIIETDKFVIKALSAIVLKRTASHLYSK